MSTNLELNCWIEGDSPNNAFPITISESRKVYDLKLDIHKSHEDRFKRQGISPGDLSLWKVSFPDNSNFEDATRDLESEKPLVFREVLSKHFSADLDDTNINIVVRAQTPDTKKRGHQLQADVNKRQKLVKELSIADTENETASMDVSDTASGVQQASLSPESMVNNAIRQAKSLIDQFSHFLKLAATTDPQLDDGNAFFVDGLGDLYGKDPPTRDRVDDLFREGPLRIVYNTSGSGKTRLLVEGLCQHWGFYFSNNLPLDPPPWLGSNDLSVCIENIGNSAFFDPKLPNSPNRLKEPLEVNQCIARAFLYKLLLARFLLLEAFLKAGADIPAVHLRRRWTYLQLMPSVLQSQFSSSQADIFGDVYLILKGHGDNSDPLISRAIANTCQDYLITICSDSRVAFSSVFIVLDEAQRLTEKYLGAFYSDKKHSSAGFCSALREICVAWGHATLGKTTLIISGTSFSLTKPLDSLRSSVAVVNSSVFTNVGAFVNKVDQEAYIIGHVPLDEDTKEEVLCRAWRWLRGRYRFTGGFVHVLRHCGTKNAPALLTRYIKNLTGYTPMDGSDVGMTHEGDFPCFTTACNQLPFIEADTALRKRVVDAINNFMLRHTPQLFKSEEADVVEFGIARHKTSGEESYQPIVIDEPIVIAGMLKYFENRPQSIEETLRERISSLPDAPSRGYIMENTGMHALARQLDGTKRLDEIFEFKTESPSIRKGKAHLIAIDTIKPDKTFSYVIVNEPWLYPLGMSFKAKDPSKYLRWFKGTGVPFCFPDTRSGPDVVFFVLVNGKIILVAAQFKSHSKDLNKSTTECAIKTVIPAQWYKDKNGKTYKSGIEPRKEIIKILKDSSTSCLGVLASWPSSPHSETVTKKAPTHFALYDFSTVEGELGRMLKGFRDDQYPDLANEGEWPAKDIDES